MQKIRACLQKTPNVLLCALGAVVFLAGFYFLCYRTPLNEVWLPTTMNNDEALYNRQVVSVLTHGGPQGYFGYQESTADIGRYGTWGPLLIWAYALPGLLFGASVNVVLWCNLLLIAVGIAVFARCARLNYWQCIALCGALFSIMLPLRSCVSGASEAMHYMLALLIVGTAAALHRSGKTGWLIACAAACAVETIFRPYALLFWVFPLTAVWQNKRRRAACLGTAAGGFAVSLFAMAKLAAPYFSDGGMDFDGISCYCSSIPWRRSAMSAPAPQPCCTRPGGTIFWPTLHGGTTYIGGGCVTFLAVVLAAVGCLLWDKHKGRPLVLKGCALVLQRGHCAGAAVDVQHRPAPHDAAGHPAAGGHCYRGRRARGRLAAGARRPAAADELPARQPAGKNAEMAAQMTDRRGRPDRRRAGRRGRPLGQHAGLRL